MTADELLRHGGACEAAGDLEGAQNAYRQADELQDGEGAILLGLVLKRLGDQSGAAEAFRRAETRRHPEAGSCLGNLLSDSGDMDGARAAYERSIAAGSITARLNLGLMLAQAGALDEALPHLRAAEEAGDPRASWAVGKILETREDLQGAAAAYRRGADGGNAQAAFGLGSVLEKLGDREGARGAIQRASDLGHDGAGKALEMMDAEATAQASVDTGASWAQFYANACGDVLDATNACLEKANDAVGARNVAAQRPQHEISIRNFTTFAENAEREFAPLYSKFEEARRAARDAAAQLLASQSDPLRAETILALGVEASVLDNVATVKGILGASYGPTPDAFIMGVEHTNALLQNPPDAGNIYRPASAAQPDERTCPWCAETIKAAAVICRYCGRDVNPVR